MKKYHMIAISITLILILWLWFTHFYTLITINNSLNSIKQLKHTYKTEGYYEYEPIKLTPISYKRILWIEELVGIARYKEDTVGLKISINRHF